MEQVKDKPVAFVVGGISPHIAVINRLKQLGYHTVLIDYKGNPVAREFADQHLQISTLDADAIEQAARDHDASVIVSVSLDQPLQTVAIVRERLGMFSPLTPAAAYNLTNKDAMKSMLLDAGVDTARWVKADSAEVLDTATLTFPVIAKPIGGTGSLGIVTAPDAATLFTRLDHCFEQAKGAGVLVEEFIEGIELSFDYIVIGGKVHSLLVRERYKTWVDEGKGVTCHATLAPAMILPEIAQLGQRQAEAIATTFGVLDGPLSIQSIATAAGRLCVLEVAGRIGGGPGSNRVVSLVTGFDYMGASIDQQIGRPVEFKTELDSRVFCAHNIYASEGEFFEMTGAEQLQVEGLILEVYDYKVAGEEVPDLLSSRSRISAIIAVAPDRDALRGRLKCIFEGLDVIDPENRSILRRDIALHLSL